MEGCRAARDSIVRGEGKADLSIAAGTLGAPTEGAPTPHPPRPRAAVQTPSTGLPQQSPLETPPLGKGWRSWRRPDGGDASQGAGGCRAA